MLSVVLTMGKESQLPEILNPGYIYITEDTHRIYVDTRAERIAFLGNTVPIIQSSKEKEKEKEKLYLYPDDIASVNYLEAFKGMSAIAKNIFDTYLMPSDKAERGNYYGENSI